MENKEEHGQQEALELKRLGIKHAWMSRPWNQVTAAPPDDFKIFTGGKGSYMTDIEGKTYLDYWAGIMFNNVGYGRKEIAEVAYKQMMKLHVQPTHQFSIPKIKLAAKLAEITPGTLSRAFFTNSGTESNETALKIAKKYQRIRGYSNKFKVISQGHYAGSTYGSMSLGWRAGAFGWMDFEPLVPGVIHLPSSYPYCYRCHFNLEYPGCDLQCAKEIEKAIQFQNPDTVAALFAQPVTSEATWPPPEYWPMVRSICDKYDLLLWVDEVVQGFGRSGKMFAMEHFDVVPDIMVLGKALTSGYISQGAAVVTKEVAKIFEGGPKEQLQHSYTFEGHAVGCAVALANIEIIEREKLIEKSANLGKYLYNQLQPLSRHPIVGDIRGGRGLMAAIELVKDKKTKQKFSKEENTKLRRMLRGKLSQAGLWGEFMNPIPILPALIITKDELDEIVTTMDRVIGEIGKELLAI
jgi:adenosylmethionine-8-amino-7-oxononanoate aminotransferase